MEVINRIISMKLQKFDRSTLLHIAIEKQNFPQKKWFLQKYVRFLLKSLSSKKLFTLIYEKNLWGDLQTISGPGSTFDVTKKIRTILPELFKTYKIKSMLDIPCGDFNWMQYVDLENINYIGADIVNELINNNSNKFSQEHRSFFVLDIVKDRLPNVDIVLCRDCLVHLTNHEIKSTIKNIKKSDSKYLLTTTFPSRKINTKFGIDRWRAINLQIVPFKFPKPLCIIHEDYHDDKNYDKSLGLWRIKDL